MCEVHSHKSKPAIVQLPTGRTSWSASKQETCGHGRMRQALLCRAVCCICRRRVQVHTVPLLFAPKHCLFLQVIETLPSPLHPSHYCRHESVANSCPTSFLLRSACEHRSRSERGATIFITTCPADPSPTITSTTRARATPWITAPDRSDDESRHQQTSPRWRSQQRPTLGPTSPRRVYLPGGASSPALYIPLHLPLPSPLEHPQPAYIQLSLLSSTFLSRFRANRV